MFQCITKDLLSVSMAFEVSIKWYTKLYILLPNQTMGMTPYLLYTIK